MHKEDATHWIIYLIYCKSSFCQFTFFALSINAGRKIPTKMILEQNIKVISDEKSNTMIIKTLGTSNITMAPAVFTGTRYGLGIVGRDMRSLIKAANSRRAAKQ